MLNVLATNNSNIHKVGGRRRLWEVIQVYGLESGDDFVGVYLSPNSPLCIYETLVAFLCQVRLNKEMENKMSLKKPKHI